MKSEKKLLKKYDDTIHDFWMINFLCDKFDPTGHEMLIREAKGIEGLKHVNSIINIAEVGSLHGISVDIDISHGTIGQLTVTLTSPEGTTVTLHNRSGSIQDDIVGNWPNTLSVDGPGTLDDFLGEATQGDWVLNVADHQTFVVGTLNAWGLNLLVGPDVTSSAGEDLPTVTRMVGNVPPGCRGL